MGVLLTKQLKVLEKLSANQQLINVVTNQSSGVPMNVKTTNVTKEQCLLMIRTIIVDCRSIWVYL